MAPTIVLDDGQPFLAVGSPGGSTIITTVLQVLVDRLDLGLTLLQAVADPRLANATRRRRRPSRASSGHPRRRRSGCAGTFTSTPEIGAATGIEFLAGGGLLAVAEPVRRGGGSAMVVNPGGP